MQKIAENFEWNKALGTLSGAGLAATAGLSGLAGIAYDRYVRGRKDLGKNLLTGLGFGAGGALGYTAYMLGAEKLRTMGNTMREQAATDAVKGGERYAIWNEVRPDGGVIPHTIGDAPRDISLAEKLVLGDWKNHPAWESASHLVSFITGGVRGKYKYNTAVREGMERINAENKLTAELAKSNPSETPHTVGVANVPGTETTKTVEYKPNKRGQSGGRVEVTEKRTEHLPGGSTEVSERTRVRRVSREPSTTKKSTVRTEPRTVRGKKFKALGMTPTQRVKLLGGAKGTLQGLIAAALTRAATNPTTWEGVRDLYHSVVDTATPSY